MNIRNVADRQCKKMIKAVAIDDLEICDGKHHRALTLQDTKQFGV